VETKTLDHTELANQIIDVIVKEGMVDREKATLDATIESLDLKSIDIVMIFDGHRGKIRRLLFRWMALSMRQRTFAI